MNRRSFLARLTGGLAAAVATATLDPDQLLWVPGQRQYFDLGGVQPFRPINPRIRHNVTLPRQQLSH
jgi:hypothetical protein